MNKRGLVGAKNKTKFISLLMFDCIKDKTTHLMQMYALLGLMKWKNRRKDVRRKNALRGVREGTVALETVKS